MRSIRALVAVALSLTLVTPSGAAEYGRWLKLDRTAVRVIDGDTIAYRGQRIRILGLQAPELHGACVAETVVGRRARDYAIQLIGTDSVEVRRRNLLVKKRTTGRLTAALDKYGRNLSQVQVNRIDWVNYLVKSGNAVPWDGRGKRLNGWC